MWNLFDIFRFVTFSGEQFSSGRWFFRCPCHIMLLLLLEFIKHTVWIRTLSLFSPHSPSLRLGYIFWLWVLWFNHPVLSNSIAHSGVYILHTCATYHVRCTQRFGSQFSTLHLVKRLKCKSSGYYTVSVYELLLVKLCERCCSSSSW